CVIALCDAPRDLQVQRLIAERLLDDQFANERFPLCLGVRIGETDAVEAVLQTAQMVRHPERLTPVNRNDLVDAVTIDESSIEYRHSRVFEREKLAVQIDDLIRIQHSALH